MRMVDLIQKKRDGIRLSDKEIDWIIKEYVNNNIPDYQVSSLLMAICFNGLDKQETLQLTKSMINSGDVVDLSKIDGIKVDKHSTGGVGDKTSLVLGPLVSSCNVKVAKMSGRGLGHTGGTLDKLESIPGFKISLTEEEFIKQVNDIYIAIIGQTNELVPADKKLYALRDVTATVSSIPLIASSIMSKKIASGSDCILLDVKYGKGAFMKDIDSARLLANTMIDIGTSLNKNTRAIISNMNQPLGNAIGNNLEVIEAINTLNGNGPKDLLELCIKAGSIMLKQANVTDNIEEAKDMLYKNIEHKKALKQLASMVSYQGGEASYIYDPSKFNKAKDIIEIKADKSGYIKDIDSKTLGLISMKLHGGRETKEDIIDHSVGLVLHKKVSDYCNKGDILVSVHTNTGLNKDMYKQILLAYTYSESVVEKPAIIEEIL